jgi:hypothetical protein
VELPPVPCWEIYLEDVNNVGQVTGNAFHVDSGLPQPFIYANGQYQWLVCPETDHAWAFGLNDHGHVVGARFLLERGDPETGEPALLLAGFLFKNGGFTTSNVTADAQTSVDSINNAGTVVGTFHRPYDNWLPHGFRAVRKVAKKSADFAQR